MRWSRTSTLVLLCGWLAGCQAFKGKSTSRPDADPLFNGINPPPATAPMGGNPAANQDPLFQTGTIGKPTSNSVPLATPTIASPAVLATGSYPPLTGGQDLRIGTTPPNTGNRILPRNQTPPGVLAVVTADPDYGKPKEAVPGVLPLGNDGQRPNAPSVGGTSGLDAALGSISALNPRWQKLENTGPSTWRFSCSVPDRQEPNKSRTYEGEGPTALAAVQNVLERIGKD